MANYVDLIPIINEDWYEKYTVKKGELFLENIARIYNICKTRQERKHGI